jgi:hypothetical protein
MILMPIPRYIFIVMASTLGSNTWTKRIIYEIFLHINWKKTLWLSLITKNTHRRNVPLEKPFPLPTNIILSFPLARKMFWFATLSLASSSG